MHITHDLFSNEDYADDKRSKKSPLHELAANTNFDAGERSTEP